MNILFYKWNVVNENRVIEALSSLGHKVIITDLKFENFEIDAKLMSQLLLEFHNNKCDCIFSINYYPFLSLICETVKKPYISWIQDSPLFTLYSPTIKSIYNYVFVFDKVEYARLVELGAVNVYHMPLAASVDYFQNAINKVNNRIQYDVSFVGSLYGGTDYDNMTDVSLLDKGFFEGLMRGQHLIYGASIIEECLTEEKALEITEKCNANVPEGYLAMNKLAGAYILEKKLTAIERHDYLKCVAETLEATNLKMDIFTGSKASSDINANYHGFVSYDEEMPRIFNASKININIVARNIRSGVPLRVFDVLASGGFLVTSYQNEIAELFENGKELVMFASEQELSELILYYLEHEDERMEIAKNGFKKVKEQFTYEMALNKIFRDIF